MKKINNNHLRLSIGMPVFNGARYLREALDSILCQTFKDFELIISDNASTDRTKQISLEYAMKDNRIRYHRNKKNIGAAKNYNHVFKLSSGKYFKWAAHDDVLAPEYLQECVSTLDKDLSIIMCHSRAGCIDKNGVLIGNYDDKTQWRISSWKPHERFADMLSPRNTCWAIHAVVRASSLARTPLHGDYIDADRNLLAEIALMGRIHEIPRHLFLRRDHPQAYTRTYYSTAGVRDYRNQLVWWTGEKKSRLIVLPHWKNCLEYLKSVNRVNLKYSERLLCYREIYRWLLKEKGLEKIKWDLINEFQVWRIQLNNFQTNTPNVRIKTVRSILSS